VAILTTNISSLTTSGVPESKTKALPSPGGVEEGAALLIFLNSTFRLESFEISYLRLYLKL